MKYTLHFQNVDKKLAAVVGDQEFTLSQQQNIPLKLIQSIMSQQLSTRVAEVFHQRFRQLAGTANPSLRRIQAIDYHELRGIGLSHAKATYVHHVAAFCAEHRVNDRMLHAMTDEEIIAFLTQIKGVGRWTVEMLLMFGLGREDVFPVDDLGIQQAMLALYKPRYTTKRQMREKLQTIAQKWSPYRTYACMHLWRYKDAE